MREERQATVFKDTREETEETGSRTVHKANERGTFGVDFAEQTDQRQTSLRDRKKDMLHNARK